jgi:molybdate/tungstate transport system substrate-binding protein
MLKRHDFAVAVTAGVVCFGTRPARATEAVNVLYAGSLVTVMERVVVPFAASRGLDVRGEGKGSVALANLIRSGLRSPDVFISADPAVLDSLMGPANGDLVAWYATFGTTRLVIGYSSASPLAPDFVEVARGRRPLVDVLLQPGLRLGRTDPALDPKGYRTIIAAELLERIARRPGFAAKLLGDDRNPNQILPEETLLARLESGDLDAAFLYATESVARGVPAVELPRAANLGDPAEAKMYATVSVTIDGKKRVGAPAAYALTIPNRSGRPTSPKPASSGAATQSRPESNAATQFVALLLSPEGRAALTKSGMTMLPHVQLVGDRAAVPSSLRPLFR